jgi:hypothetical protein
MQGCSSAADREALGEKLQELTGQKHGADAEAWKTWLARQPKPASAPAK